MMNRVALLSIALLLAAAPIACHPPRASTTGGAATTTPDDPSVAGPAGDAPGVATTTSPVPATASADPSTVEPPVAAALPRSVRVTRSVTVGKWPEEVAVLGDHAFVATSGSRIVEHIDLKTGTNERSIRAGTFPVSIVTGASEVWTADYNRKRTLFEIDASGKATARGTLPDHVETLAFADGVVFALLAKHDSSVNSSVVRFDPKTGKQQRSDPTGKDPAGLAVGHGKVWAAAGGGLMVLSPESLAIEVRIPVEARLAEVFTNGSAVYVASSADGAYFRIDPTTREVTGPFAVGEPFVMAVRDQDVVTLGHSGTLTIWDSDAGVARVKLDVGQPIAGQWMTWYGSDLVVTAHGTSDEKKGTLHVLSLE